jgi:stage V sporulation protein AD
MANENKFIGRSSVEFSGRTSLLNFSSIVGEEESKGPIGNCFDRVVRIKKEKTSWEEYEYRNYISAIELALRKSSCIKEDISFMVGGDLLNQIISSGYAARNIGIPFLGIYGACSNLCESLFLGACLHDGYFGRKILCVTSSHFCTAERQYRGPLEQGGQRPPHAQHTVTGSGAYVIGEGGAIIIDRATVGKVIDYGIADANNMGAAMAPAAADSIMTHLKDFNLSPDYYDLYITGDLGFYGSKLMNELLIKDGIDISEKHTDCGCEIYDRKTQDINAGGSGCGCSAVVFSGYFLPKLLAGEYQRILMIATGALMSPTSVQQGETIPGIAHAVAFRLDDKLC